MAAKLKTVATATATANTKLDNLEQFRIDALISHNIYRERHDSIALQHCRVLSDYAQNWAEKVAKEDKIIHSSPDWRMQYNNIMLGENIVSTNGFRITGKGMSDMWYSESFKHDFSRDAQLETKSFTQMIWNESRQVGFGRIEGKNKKWFAVALYHPYGNIEGEFIENVKPLPNNLDENKPKK
jgi:hypothetical protein